MTNQQFEQIRQKHLVTEWQCKAMIWLWIKMYEGGVCTFWPQFEFLKAANLHLSSDYLIQWPQQNSESGDVRLRKYCNFRSFYLPCVYQNCSNRVLDWTVKVRNEIQNSSLFSCMIVWNASFHNYDYPHHDHDPLHHHHMIINILTLYIMILIIAITINIMVITINIRREEPRCLTCPGQQRLSKVFDNLENLLRRFWILKL